MKMTVVTAPGETRVVEAPQHAVESANVLVAGHDGGMPIGHEPAGEVVEVGRDVTGIAVGDHVVINPMVAPSGIIVTFN
jgi:threonine dehydrogenase-like Zn-dependent dehydrogenase